MIRFKNILALSLLLAIILGNQSALSQTVHSATIWGGAGYSSILHGIDNTKVPGGFGFEAGIGYQLDLNNFMLSIGAEYQHLNSKTNMFDYQYEYPFYYTDQGQASHIINYKYDFLTYQEKHSIGYLNFPIMAGIRFNRYYAMLGAKVGLNLLGNYTIQNTKVHISADDTQFIDPMEGIGHATGDQTFTRDGKMSLGLSVAPTAEFGMYLDEWLPGSMTQIRNGARSMMFSYRLGVFVDYGVLNINTSSTNKPMVSEPLNNDPSDIGLNPLAESNLANDKRFGNLIAGVKLTVEFQLNRPPKPKKVDAIFPFYALVVDEETKEPLNAEVTLTQAAGRRQQMLKENTDSEGMIMHQGLKVDRYQISATSEGYHNYKKVIRHSKEDTVLVPMKLVPIFYAHVFDAETKENLKAEITIASPTAGAGSKPILKAETDEKTGLLEGNIRTGRYQLNVTKEGYIYHQEIVNYSKTDTIQIALQPIKKDVVVVLNDLYFALNEATMLPESEPGLNDLSQFLTNNPSVSIKITGHTDNTGRLEYNMRLSEARAKAVFDELIKRGIDPSRITYEGKGPNQPVATNETEEGRAQNRRVEFVIQ